MKTVLIVIFLASNTPTSDGWSCKEVRAMVKLAGSVEQAERYARASGVPESWIEKARRCVVAAKGQ